MKLLKIFSAVLFFILLNAKYQTGSENETLEDFLSGIVLHLKRKVSNRK